MGSLSEDALPRPGPETRDMIHKKGDVKARNKRVKDEARNEFEVTVTRKPREMLPS